MPGTALSAVMGIPDAVGTFRFTFFVTIPTGLNTIGTTRDLHLRCQTVDLPGRTIETMDVALHGQPQRHFRGRGTFQGMMAINFIETMDGLVHKTLHQWMEKVVGSTSGNGNISGNYATNAVINVLDPQGNPFQQCTVFKMWPTTIPDINLDGSNGTQPYLIQSQWAYDYVSWAQPSPPDIAEDTDGTAADVT
jgi:hypothetical protein